MTRIASSTSDRRRAVSLERGGDDTEPDRLREHQHVAGACVAVGEHARRIDGADDREPELRLGIVDGMSTTDDRAGGAHDVVTAVEHAREQLERQALAWPGDEVEREQRRATHRVDVGQRVGRRDPTPVVRIVDDRREEVGGDDDGEVVAEAIDRGVVGGVETHEEVGIRGRVTEPADEAEHGAQVGGRQLAGAPRAVRERGEPYPIPERRHVGTIIAPRRRRFVRSGDQPGRTAPMTPDQIGVICTTVPVCGAWSTLPSPT